MFPRQNQNTKKKSKDIKKEEEAEKNNASRPNTINNIMNTGNENAGKLILEEDDDDMFNWSGLGEDEKKDPVEKVVNEIKKAAEDKEDEEEDEGFFAWDALEKDKKKAPVEKKEVKKGPEPAPDISTKSKIEDDDSEDEDDLFGNVSKKVKNEINNLLPKTYGQKDPAKELFPGDKPAIQQFYEDPDERQEGLIDDPDFDHFNRKNPLNRDMVVEHSRKKGKKKKNNNDLARVNNTQQKIAGLNIGVHKLAARNKAGGFKRFMSNLAIAAGTSFGRFINWIGAGIARIFNKKYRDIYARGQSNSTENPDIQQESRRHDLIPGWNGEKFQQDPNGTDDILADFRRIPTVWSTLTAGQAEDKNGKPLAPKISIYVRQGREAEDQSVNGTDPGHAGIGIEYSRYSKVSERYERYNLRYGFYPATQDTQAGSISMTGNARIPGQLKDESNANYSVRRTYPATAKQVNAILNASETFADKGYNSFNRNCTTFVKEMIQQEAGIPAGKEIFEEETPGFSGAVNFALFASKSSENTSKAAMEKRFARLGNEDDLNYGGDGNKRVNQQDYQNYKESLEFSDGGYIDTADLPNVAAENMRRMEGKNAGSIGSKYYFGTAEVNPNTVDNKSSGSSALGGMQKPKMNVKNLSKAISDESTTLTNAILSVTRKGTIRELCATPGIDPDVKAILGQIKSYNAPLNKLNTFVKDANMMRNSRSALEKQVNDLNTLLFGFFKNDARIHLPVMHMISLLEYGINYIDREYQHLNIGLNVKGELGNIRGKMDNSKDFTITYKKNDPDDPNAKPRVMRAKLSPSRYEAYLQIYKSPDKAIDSYVRFEELADKENKSKEEVKEYQKLKRLDDLSFDYAASHRYMLEKDSYSQQDVDYTFNLEKMEKKIATSGNLSMNSSSGIYKSLILEKIFGDVTQRFENNFTAEDTNNSQMVQEWLDEDMCTCVERRSNEMEKVIKGMKKAMPELDEKGLLDYLMSMIKNDSI